MKNDILHFILLVFAFIALGYGIGRITAGASPLSFNKVGGHNDSNEKVYFTICRDTLTESHYLSLLIGTDSNYWGSGTIFGDGGEELKKFSMTKREMRKILNHRD